jgi:hypothetical protein
MVMNHSKRIYAGLEALAGDVPLLPAEASSPAAVHRLKPLVRHFSAFAGLEALAGEVPLLPAEASSPAAVHRLKPLVPRRFTS